MSLLHATWLPAIRTSSSSGQPALLVWADTWRVATPEGPGLTPALHPFTLSHDDLRAWLSERDLLPGGCIDATACLTLPSRTVKPRKSRSKKEEPTPEPPGWTGLPMQAGEPIPKRMVALAGARARGGTIGCHGVAVPIAPLRHQSRPG